MKPKLKRSAKKYKRKAGNDASQKLRLCAFVHRDANVKDYQWLPSRSIQKGSDTRTFAKEPNEETRRLILEAIGFSDMQSALKKTRTQALIVVQGEKILLEEYGKNYDHDSIVTSFSVAKSVNSAMVGTLIESGKIKSEDEPITNYIPELLERDARFGRITIKNLLNMSSGILYAETPNPRMDNTETYYNPDLRKLALTNTEIKEEPGEHFLYNNYNPLLLGLIIERVAKQNVCEYLSQSIWSKIGCERDATWSLDSDEDAFEKMESGINTIAMDFVRFACMYRDGGKVFGKQVVSQEWIKKSIATQARQIDYYSDHWGKDIFNHGASYCGSGSRPLEACPLFERVKKLVVAVGAIVDVVFAHGALDVSLRSEPNGSQRIILGAKHVGRKRVADYDAGFFWRLYAVKDDVKKFFGGLRRSHFLADKNAVQKFSKT